MIGLAASAAAAIQNVNAEAARWRRLEAHMAEALSPDDFKAWKAAADAERTAERRHRELCRSIERAGDNARFRLW